VLSLVVAVIYLGPLLFQSGPSQFIKVALWMATPFFAIWYPVRTAEVVSAIFGRGEIEDDPSERLIIVLAWVAYLMPLLGMIYVARAIGRG